MGELFARLREEGVSRLKEEVKKLFLLEIRSVRANLLPMMVLWVLAGAAVVLYYLVPGVADSLKVFADIQVKYGKLASFLNRVISGGVLPGIFLLAMPTIRPPRPVATVINADAISFTVPREAKPGFYYAPAEGGTKSQLFVGIAKTAGFYMIFH